MMEALTEHFRALLEACVAVNAAAAASTDATDIDARIKNVDLSVGLTSEQLRYWDSLCDKSLPLVQDLGLLLASTTVASNKILILLRVMLVHPSLHCYGLVRLAHMTFDGLKVAKRWDALNLVSIHIIDAVYTKILQSETRKQALRLYIDILVGFQHSAKLYLINLKRITDLAELLSTEQNDQNNDMVHQLLVMCAALEHCHRGYEAEARILRRSMCANFGPQVIRPAAAQAEVLLRSSAWVLPAEKMDAMLPSIEGKWVEDEFNNDPHGNGGPRNSGSVRLKKTTNCFAYEMQATMTNRNLKQRLELTGCFFRQIPEMQVLLAHPETIESTKWELEGHWRQLYDEDMTFKSEKVAPSSAPTWDCRACTMNNEGVAMKCLTCGTDRPAEATMSTIPSCGKGSNPAPFSAVFDSDLSFMRMKWSRGEQQGVWLARKQVIESCFDLRTSLEAANNEMMDSTYLPAFVFSPKGNPASVLVLEQPLLSMSNHKDFTIQVWISPEPSPLQEQDQVVLAYGRDFALQLSSTGHLVLQIAGGQCMVTSCNALQFGTFCHMTLFFGLEKVALFVDGSIAGEIARVNEGGPFTSEPSLLSIGGSLESCRSSKEEKVPSCFYGQILDLRIWSTLVSDLNENWSIWTALSGQEAHLVGYFPLVGKSERLLMDFSKQQNHACVFEAYQSADALHDATISSIHTFVPAAPTNAVPVQNTFAISLGDDFAGTGKFSLLDCAREGDRGLQVNCEGVGAALWRQHAVSIAHGFESMIFIASPVAVDSRTSVVFALCEASFWDLVPLVVEATYLSQVASDARESTLGYFGGPAMLVKIDLEATTSGILMYELELCIWSKQQPNPLVRVCRVAGGPSTSPSGVQIKYELPERVLSLDIGGVGHVLEAAVDLELALRIESDSPVRTGLIFPPSKALSSQQATTELLNWTFKAMDDNMLKESASSILRNVYSFLQAESLSADSGQNNGENDSVLCTRVSTDGSAIAQESFGCQTCSLVHENCVCRICAVICHEGHELVAHGVTTTACACRVRGNGLCRCTSAIPASEYIALNQPVNANLWGCTKCTVINRIELKQCSVCGNNRPEISAILSTGAPECSSTSLVECKQPKLAQDWSCGACTMLNDATAIKCSMCDTPRPKEVDLDVVETTQESKTDHRLTTLCYAAEGAAKQDQALAMQPVGSWICSACTMENQASDKSCYMCATVRELPVAAAFDPPDTMMALPASKLDPTMPSSPASLSMKMNGSDKVGPSGSETDWHVSKLENVKLLEEYKRTAVLAVSNLLDFESMNNEVWETTGGNMHLRLNTSFVGEYIRGTYVEKDGKVSGLARLTKDGAWKFDGRYKKSSHSQSNACSFYWDKAASRFDGKWYRGDGSGDWKCLSWPNASDFRGLAPIDPVKKPNELQPYYAGMVNMKQNLTNVCYQNSFLQTLYMTQDFRRLMLSWDAQNYMTSFEDEDGLCGGNVVATIQNLFAQMTASQRPYIATQVLQRCLPPEFKNGRQQDTSDFAHFVIDSLTQQMSQHVDTVDDIRSIFGGHQATIFACKVCGNKSINREYFWELLLNMIDLRYTPIISISAVRGSSMDIHTPEGYERLNTDLNKDRTGAPYVYLCVKRCPEWASANNSMMNDHERILPITELMVKVALSSDPKPTVSGFERVELDLNIGGSASTGVKKQVYLFFRREPEGSPITDLQVIYGTDPVPDGFKQIQVDLNQGDGSKVYLCYRCDMPITDLKIVSSGIPGYRMIDHSLNLSHQDGEKQYLALKVGGNEPCLTDLKLVEDTAVSTHEQQGWEAIGRSRSVHEPSPSGTSLVPAQLMVRRGHGNPIFAIDVFRAPRRVPKYNDYEVIDLYPVEESCTDAVTNLLGDWIGTDDTDRGRKAVKIRSVSDSIPNALLVKGIVDGKGELTCVATRLSTWSDAVTTGSVESLVPTDCSFDGRTRSDAPARVYRVSGYWKTSTIPGAQLFDVELRPAPNGVSSVPDSPAHISSQGGKLQSYTMYGMVGDGTGKPIVIKGIQTSRKGKVKWPISELVILRGDERVPQGFEVVRDTCSGRSGNLLAQTASPHALYLALKREEAPVHGYITDIVVIYSEIDAVPDHYTCIETTPAGYSANLNDGTSGVPIFICVKKSGDATAVESDGTSTKSVMDVTLMWTSGTQPDPLPTGFVKIQHTPLGMDANLNQGTGGVAIHLCVSKCETKAIVKPLENLLNGEYEITSSPLPAFGRFLSLSVVEELDDARSVDGTFGVVLHAQSTGSISGLLVSSKLQQTGEMKKRMIIGAWRCESPMAGGGGANLSACLPSNYPFELTLNDAGTELNGWWSGVEAVPGNVMNAGTSVAPSSGTSAVASVIGGKWKLVRDGYVHIAFKRDYGTEWQDGKLVFSERVWRHDIKSMLSRFVATRTLGGDNALLCSTCECKTESRTHTVIFDPPEHLIITLKRMYYDWSQQKACKCLHDVRFPAFLTLPSLTPEEHVALDDVDDASTRDKQSRHYGLYGVLVHSGLTANSGHYYSFCRESDESTRQLHLEDSPLCPWIKFNDTKVERSNWKEIHRVVSGTVSDTVYLLLYKKLSYEPTADREKDASVVESVPSDDDEAMLLAKAMALSMSAAKQSKQTEEKERKSEPNALNSEDPPGLSTGVVTKKLLEKVQLIDGNLLGPFL
ncbi:hypothetical protein PsorP6_009066 [Peronosclerospora sorghi]|uniref:Uncharacterized protein n=1 Tax=Peronosclerospora sorghi TaxID=230839 RepID=A0ACC0VZW0_9STRA|nr:hypothetical protein PsorP6_009066 [Peronosclerospora sorghi]